MERNLFFKSLAISFCLLFTSPTVGRASQVNADALASKNQLKQNKELFNIGVIDSLPSGYRWLQHLNQELMPFWNMKPALGNPIGNFPSFRCNNGSLWNPNNPCPELTYSLYIKNDLDKKREYVVAKSRQTYVYCVAYHLTGNERMLQLAKAGVDYIRKNALESNGGAITYWDDGISGPPESQRNSQDLAYTALGLSSYYYLTRDDDVLQDIIKLKNYIFSNYYNSNLDMMMFTKGSNSKKLIAQLDQLNTYMVLVTPLLPEPIKTQWKTDLLHLSRIMISKFYSSKYNLFWREGNPGQNFLKADFGHTIKAFWMIYLTSKLTNDSSLRTFVEAQAPKVLEKAYIRSTGSWGTTLNSDGSVNGIKISWMYNELDQTAATLSLKYPSLTQYLTNTYKYWFRNMVDYNYYENGQR